MRHVKDYWVAFLLLFVLAYMLKTFRELYVVRGMVIILYVVAIFGLVIAVLGRRHALRVWGGGPGSTLNIVQRLEGTRAGVLDLDVAITMISIGSSAALISLAANGGWFSLGLFVFTCGVSVLSRLTTPPLVTYLAVSCDETRQLAHQISWALIPHRVINLLTVVDSDGMLGESLRMLDDPAWLDRLTELLHLSRVIILDCRRTTPATIAEARAIIGTDFVQRTIFVGDDRRRCELLSAVLAAGGATADMEVYVIRARALIPTLQRMFRLPQKCADAESLTKCLVRDVI